MCKDSERVFGVLQLAILVAVLAVVLLLFLVVLPFVHVHSLPVFQTLGLLPLVFPELFSPEAEYPVFISFILLQLLAHRALRLWVLDHLFGLFVLLVIQMPN